MTTRFRGLNWVNGQSYNINADTSALGAEKLILLSGILEDRDDPWSLVKEIDIKGVKKMMEDGKIGGGIIPKVNCCVRSLAQGVPTPSIIDGRLNHSLLIEILTDEGAGTMISYAAAAAIMNKNYVVLKVS